MTKINRINILASILNVADLTQETPNRKKLRMQSALISSVHTKTRNKLERAATTWNELKLTETTWNKIEAPVTR